MASIMNHSHHLQLRKVCLVSLSSKNSPCITNRLVKLMSLSARPKDSPWNANNPNSISVRFGRSIGHFTNGGLLEIDTVITSEKHSAPTSMRSRAVRSMFHSIGMTLTLNPQFVTAIETRSVFFLLAHLQRLQRVTIYTLCEGEEHTSHNELNELNTTPASNTQRVQE